MQTIREAGSMPPNLVRHLLKAATHIPRSGCKSGMGVTASACLRMARIWLPLNRWRWRLHAEFPGIAWKKNPTSG